MFRLDKGPADNKVEAVAVSESVPDGVGQNCSGVFVHKDKLAPKRAVLSLRIASRKPPGFFVFFRILHLFEVCFPSGACLAPRKDTSVVAQNR